MDFPSVRLLELLPVYGPWLLFALAFLETCFLTGLIVPAGLATVTGTALALDDSLGLLSVVGAVFAGGVLGDSVGYWLGRITGERVLRGDGRWAHMLRRRGSLLNRWFGRHPVYSVTLARVVSFVRTVMPMAAGMSRIRYARFLVYDVLGLVACVGLYVAIGALAQESWEAVTRALGIGGAAAFALTAMVVWWTLRSRVARRRARRAGVDPAREADSGSGKRV